MKGYAIALAERGHEVVIATTDRDGSSRLGPVDMIQDSRIPVVWERVHFPKFWAASIPLAHSLSQLIRDADIVHIHSLYLFPTLAASRIAYARNVPYVIRPHGSLTEYHLRRRYWKKAIYHRLAENVTLERAAAVHATSRQEAESLERLPFKFKAIRVVPIGVKIPTHFDRARRSANRCLTIGFLGRLAHKKRPWLLIETLAETPELRALVAGPDDEHTVRGLRSLSRGLGVSERVEFLGFVDGQEKEDFFRRIDVLVLPSMEENFGIAVPEALARGRPVLLTEGVAVASEVASAGAGWIVSPTPSALSQQLTSLRGDEALLERAGRAARKLAVESFSWNASGAALESLYETVLRSPK